jgi:pimeloyl-ACP methyl ester carboxylesterase
MPPETIRIETAPGFAFDALTGGDADAPLVLLLHGFAESFHMWRALVPALAEAGYRAVAPSQRGYSRGARPDTSNHAAYAFDNLVADAMAVAECAGRADRFHLVGHDWGGSLAWAIADRYPQRLHSLTVLSRPHPIAFNRALEMPDGEQKRRSAHHHWFLEADAVPRLLADDARWLRERHTANGVPPEATARHLAVIGNEAAMSGALAWYRARGGIRTPLGHTRVPTLYIWGDADDTVGRAAAEGTAACIDASYRFEVLPGGGHFTAEQFPERVNALVLEHLNRWRADDR